MDSIPISGGAGLIGLTLTRRLLGSGARVVLMDLVSGGGALDSFSKGRLTVVEDDISNPEALRRIVKSNRYAS